MAEDPPDPPNERLSSYMPGIGLPPANTSNSRRRRCAHAHASRTTVAANSQRQPRARATREWTPKNCAARVRHPTNIARRSLLLATFAAPADQKPMSLMDQLNAMSSTAAKAADDVAAEGAKTDAKMGRVRRKSKDLEDTINAVAAAAAVPEPETAKPEHLKRMDDY